LSLNERTNREAGFNMCLVDVLGFMVEPEFQSFACKLEFVSMLIRHGHGVRDARGGGAILHPSHVVTASFIR
jgi:hypothetical protein